MPICRNPLGNPENLHTITIGEQALPQSTFALDCDNMLRDVAWWRGFDGDPALGAVFEIAAVSDFFPYEDTCQCRTYCNAPLECPAVRRLLYVPPEEHDLGAPSGVRGDRER